VKESKNADELLELLELKKVIINNKVEAKVNIEKYTYYSIISGYKHIFKTKERRIQRKCCI